jgi:hypothetical protein
MGGKPARAVSVRNGGPKGLPASPWSSLPVLAPVLRVTGPMAGVHIYRRAETAAGR